MATALRKQTSLSGVPRVAVVAVRLEANASYEVEHHWNAALTRVSDGTARAIARFEMVDCLMPRKFVIRLEEMTLNGRVSDATWAATSFSATTTDGAAVDHCLVQLRRAQNLPLEYRERAVVRGQ